MAKKGTRRKQNIPKDESKVDRFVRVVTPRVAKAIKAIRQIGFCAGANYEYTPKQVEQVLAAIDTARAALEKEFVAKEDKQSGFTFKE